MPAPLEYAQSQVGVREATGHNDGVPSERYADGEQIEWCAAFVRTCFEKGSRPLPGNRWRIRACAEMLGQLQAFDCEVPKADACPEDIVFFTREHPGAGPTGHVGIIETVEEHTGIITTIEGNRGNAVGRGRYLLTDRRVLAICRWDGSKMHRL